MAETTPDERKPEATDEDQEPDARAQREPKATEDERKPEERDEEQPESKDESKDESNGSKDEREPEATQDEREQEPKDLPEPEEKSADDLLGQQVVDPHGYTIGKIEALFIHGQDERASWARVKTGLIRSDSVFVPLHDAQEDGGQIRVVYEKEHVNAAPEIEPDGNELSDDDADVLHSHYGLERVKGLSKETAEEGDIELPRETRDANPPTLDEPPWAVEKYPLPDMERPEEKGSSGGEEEESSRGEGEESSRGEEEESSGEESSDEESSGQDSEERASG